MRQFGCYAVLVVMANHHRQNSKILTAVVQSGQFFSSKSGKYYFNPDPIFLERFPQRKTPLKLSHESLSN